MYSLIAKKLCAWAANGPSLAALFGTLDRLGVQAATAKKGVADNPEGDTDHVRKRLEHDLHPVADLFD